MIELVHFKKRIYYSQNREDIILKAFFPDVNNGFYIDVGAYDPDEDSVTKLFYLEGWRGINIEPQPDKHLLFKDKRPRDINVNVGIALKESTLTLRTYSSKGLATLSDEIKKSYVSSQNSETKDFEDITVSVLPLKKVLSDHKPPVIHFMKVDVEGFEYDVLASNDWQKFKPQVLCIEANHKLKNWENILINEGYELVFNDGLNNYYCDKTTERKKLFDYVQYVVIELGGGLRYSDYLEMERVNKENSYLTQELEGTIELVKQKDNELTELKKILLDKDNILNSLHRSSSHVVKLANKRIVKRIKRAKV